MDLFHLSLILSALLCSLVAGFLFAFAVVVMPGIKKLRDADFLRAFQVMDRIIQDNQPLFILVWIGSAIALIAATVLGLGPLDFTGRCLIVLSAATYLLGVQLPTIAINIPLNNELQTLDIATLDLEAAATARSQFEPRWNRWNVMRTWLSCLVSLLLLTLLLRQ